MNLKTDHYSIPLYCATGTRDWEQLSNAGCGNTQASLASQDLPTPTMEAPSRLQAADYGARPVDAATAAYGGPPLPFTSVGHMRCDALDVASSGPH